MPSTSPQNPIYSEFTDRQLEILRARASGETIASIARRLGISRGRVQQIEQGTTNRIEQIAQATRAAEAAGDILDTPIEVLSLSTRSVNALRRAGKRTIRDLLSLSPRDILAMKNIGRACLDEIEEIIHKYA